MKSANDAINAELPKKAISKLKKVACWSQTSECYHRVLGRYYMSQRRFDEAAFAFEKALLYISTPDLNENIATCYLNIGFPETALYYLDISSNIQPSRFTPRYRMMHIYNKMGLSDEAKAMAEYIVKMPVKINSKEVRRIRVSAQNFLTGKHRKQTFKVHINTNNHHVNPLKK